MRTSRLLSPAVIPALSLAGCGDEEAEVGELHVHSTPEQEIEFDAGKSQQELVIKQPGVVEVEDHEAEFVIAASGQLT